jgi:hypothetical protein
MASPYEKAQSDRGPGLGAKLLTFAQHDLNDTSMIGKLIDVWNVETFDEDLTGELLAHTGLVHTSPGTS